MIHKSIFLIGLFLALFAIAGVFFFSQLVSPPPVVVVTARVDLPSGTSLADLPENALAPAPLRGDASLLSSFVTEADFKQFQASGGVLRERVRAGEPLRKSAIVASLNDAAVGDQSLQLSDPNLMIVRLVVSDNAPEVQEGDLVDLGVSVANLAPQSAVTSVLALPPVNASSSFLPPATSSETTSFALTPTITPTPTLTPTPAVLAPLAKTIVHAAVVTHVVREPPINTSIGNAQTARVEAGGKITAIDVMIPRPSFEVVTMAAAAGKLSIGLLSPLADRSGGPTLGASLTDFLNWFYADRAQITPKAGIPGRDLPTATPTASALPIPPTATSHPEGGPQ